MVAQRTVAQRTQTLNLGSHNHEIRDPADAALELTIRAAARAGRRICVVCAEEKPLEEFPKAGRGRSQRCRSCAMKAAEKIGEAKAAPASAGDRDTPTDVHHIAEEAAETAERVAGIAERVTALREAIRTGGGSDSDSGAADSADDEESDPDVAHAELLEPEVTESIKRYVRGTVKGTAALMVRDMVKTAVREAAAAIVPELVTEALVVEMRKHPMPMAAAVEMSHAHAHETEPTEPTEPQEERDRIPALVTALLERQPLQQRGWGCATERARWLAAFTAVLDVVFPVADGCDRGEEVAHVHA